MPPIYGFDQGPKNVTVLEKESNEGINGNFTNMGFNRSDSSGSMIFQFRFESMVRFEKNVWDKKRRRVRAECDVGVGSDGMILANFVDDRCPVSIK